MGERDIEKKILELPIPAFSKNDPAHIRLAQLGKKASKEAEKAVTKLPTSRALGLKRKTMRDGLNTIIQEIDSCVKRIFKLTEDK